MGLKMSWAEHQPCNWGLKVLIATLYIAGLTDALTCDLAASNIPALDKLPGTINYLEHMQHMTSCNA